MSEIDRNSTSGSSLLAEYPRRAQNLVASASSALITTARLPTSAAPATQRRADPAPRPAEVRGELAEQ